MSYEDVVNEAIKKLAGLGREIEKLVGPEFFSAAATFWPQSMSTEEVVGFALSCAEIGRPWEDFEGGIDVDEGEP